ncbi:deacetylase complex subunit Sds3 [Cladophialophora carrionii]|uniref:Deacetylase complex subunit Sds3 n=1 Tax=Cladophialophora carrionii TaxID=86049 RepID=A0A1C1D031_9EURO|nr:deacetylase complex subunit Sds3 [Cladophialophora carrionii]
MAYSPSPASPLGWPDGSAYPQRQSPTPPAQPLSKRDKRRNQHVAHQQELYNELSSRREQHYREQLIALQHDMSLISQTDPYEPEPLEDSPEEINKITELTASSTPYQSQMSSLAGKWYAEFVHEISDAKIAKEVALIQLMNNHNKRLERLKYECDYRLHLAAEECEQMTSTLRERLFQALSSKRQRLMKEKEQLDIADTNALLLHPSQFSITNPASPGGNHTSRKTRFTRHREQEDMNGVGEVTNKRKRKLADDDVGSPSRNGISTPGERGRAALSNQTAPLYSIHTLFTEKELNFQSHQAQIAARHFFSTSRKEGETSNARNRHKVDDDRSRGSDGSASEEDEELEAPEMDRLASQNVHVTRSTRTIGGMSGLNALSELAEKAATRPALPYATLHTHQGRQGTFLPQPSRLMAEELEEDLFKITQSENQPKGQLDRRAVEEALKPLSESRSNLAPDWPVYLDVHLVDVDPRKATGV